MKFSIGTGFWQYSFMFPIFRSNKPVEIELSINSSTLYIFFGGIAAGITMPPFEFYNSSKIIDEHKIFIRDFYQCWYQGGLPKISDDVHSTAIYIKSKIDEIRPSKVFFVGNSMGGYASILFNKLIGIGEAIAFAPQTFITPDLRLKHHDRRWEKRIQRMYKKCKAKEVILDLRPILVCSKQQHSISVFVSRNDKLDHIHANHIGDLTGVTVHEFDDGGHGVVKMLRDRGKLPAIMSGAYT